MTEWYEVRLGDICELKRGYDLPASARMHGDVPVVSSSGITGWHSKAKVAGPGVVTGRYGTLGEVFYVDQEYWPLNTALYVRDFRGNIPRFIYYLLQVTDLGSSQGAAAAVPGVNRNVLHELPVRVPSVANQQRIADVLTAFDELIENNRRRIEVLEEAARSLYREWFVHFRFPGHESREFLETPFGLIPEGWQWARFGDLATWLSGGTPSTKVAEYWDGEIPWITSGSLTSFLLSDSERRLTPSGVAAGSRLVERDALLFVVRGMSLVKEFRRGIADRPLAFGQDCKALVAKPGIDPLFLAFAVDAMETKIHGMVELAGHGTGKLSTDRLQVLRIPVPDDQTMDAFVGQVRPVRELLSAITMSVEPLLRARDALLAKLVTGAIEVDSLRVDDVFGWAELATAG